MKRKLVGTKHGGLNMSSPTESQTAEDNAPPTSPTATIISSTTAGGSPAANAPVDAKLQALHQLLENLYHIEPVNEKERVYIIQEGNAIGQEQRRIEEAQEALDKRKYDYEEREKKHKRALEVFEEDMSSLECKIRRRNEDPNA